jgi:hypothetical protein
MPTRSSCSWIPSGSFRIGSGRCCGRASGWGASPGGGGEQGATRQTEGPWTARSPGHGKRSAWNLIRISAPPGRDGGAGPGGLEPRGPWGPFLFPDDDLATAPVRFFVASSSGRRCSRCFPRRDALVRSSAGGGVPEGGTGGEGRTYINVVLHVERASQKGILVGEGGRMIRKLGTDSRRKIEAFLGEPVFLELWVKVMPRWRRKKGELRRMGLPVPRDAMGLVGGGAGLSRWSGLSAGS